MAIKSDNLFWKYNNISSIHIELSSKCNAACPGCARFQMNSPIVDPALIQTEITYETFVKWFPKDLLPQIYNWILCGTLGDPLACKDIYEILEYICEHSPGNIQINTNGGLRNKTLYSKIGKLFSEKRNYNGVTPHRVITFSIDGLEDTNHIYRRNVKWNAVWKNLMAYVETGAEAHWDFLQFKHNHHQIETAKKLAQKYGIIFVLKNPFGVDRTAMPVYNKKLEFEYAIEHAVNHEFPPYVPAGIEYRAPFPILPIKQEGSITCMAKRNAPYPYHEKEITEIFVDVLGRVLPCCFVGNRLFIRHTSDAIQVQQIQENMRNKNNLHYYCLEEILNNKELEIWKKSWKNKDIAICWNQCGKNNSKERHIDTLLKDST
jgi:MoaA/NifB/PqqE/SkfB family radical SAM enzyme